MADKKLLEESTIRRFMELANIKPTEKGMLSESAMPAGGKRSFAGRGKDGSAAGGARKAANGGVPSTGIEEAMDEDLEENMEEGYGQEESALEEVDDEGGDVSAAPMDDSMDSLAGDEMGAESEGGDLESAAEELVSAMNNFFSAAGMSDKTVELDSGEGEGGEDEMPPDEEDDVGGEEEAPVMERKAKKQQDEELEESIELVDDTLVEKLLQRVSARLVAEARKSRELAESKKGWGKVPSKAASHKSSTKGKGPGKGTPFTKKMTTKGLANR